MITSSPTWITRSLQAKSFGVCFISRVVVKVMKFREPLSTLSVFWSSRL